MSPRHVWCPLTSYFIFCDIDMRPFLKKERENYRQKMAGKALFKNGFSGSIVSVFTSYRWRNASMLSSMIAGTPRSIYRPLQELLSASGLFWSMKKPKRANRKKRNAKGTSVWPVWVSFHQWKRAFEGDMIFEGSMYGWPLLFLAKKGKNRPDWLDHKTRTYLIYWSLKWMCLII